jgi:predicted Zn-dependent protease
MSLTKSKLNLHLKPIITGLYNSDFITGKNPFFNCEGFNIVPSDQIDMQAKNILTKVLKGRKIIKTGIHKEMIDKTVRQLLAPLSTEFLNWEFILAEKDEFNAHALPFKNGAKICIYTGLFKKIKSTNELAVILSHEIAHIIAGHTARLLTIAIMSQKAVSFFKDSKDKTSSLLIDTICHFAVTCPFSRQYEYEADKTGIMIMKKAGFDIHEAPRFWENFILNEKNEANEANDDFTEFLSTHPFDKNRAENLKKIIKDI